MSFAGAGRIGERAAATAHRCCAAKPFRLPVATGVPSALLYGSMPLRPAPGPPAAPGALQLLPPRHSATHSLTPSQRAAASVQRQSTLLTLFPRTF